MFCQHSCWLLNMIDRGICVCCISPVHRQPPAACQTLRLPVAHQRGSLSKNLQCSTELLYKHSFSLSYSSSPCFFLLAEVSGRLDVAKKNGKRMIVTFIECGRGKSICQAQRNNHHQLLHTDKQLVREGIRN